MRSDAEIAAKAAELEALADAAVADDLTPRWAPALQAIVDCDEEYQRVQQDAEQRLADAVTIAHRDGYSWSEIGLALGVTKQAAYKRFANTAKSDAKSA